jgi:soluble lytic murein transglycosylase
MQKFFRPPTPLAISIGLASLVILGFLGFEFYSQNQSSSDLKAIADKEEKSLNSQQTTLVSASNLIKDREGQQALQQLENLETTYPLLAPYILLKQGKAYQVAQETTKAQAIWHRLIEKYPDSSAVAEALYLLGRENSTYWEQAIQDFPQHPRTHQIIKEELAKNPDRWQLMSILVRYAPDRRGTELIGDRLVGEYSDRLTAEDWQAIGDIYWLKWDYAQAAKAYLKADRII